MKVLIALTMYDVDDVCTELAKLTGKQKKYSPQRVQVLIQQHLPMAERIGKRYLLTERQLKWLSTKVYSIKRPSKY